jgi:hypothetical protein
VDLDDNTLNYGIHGSGNTAKDAVDDFILSYEAMRELYHQREKHFVEAEFVFHYDTASFLTYYTTYFSLAGISRLTGVNQRQLSHYLNGTRNPSKQTIQKIDNSIHAFAKNLSQVQFV